MRITTFSINLMGKFLYRCWWFVYSCWIITHSVVRITVKKSTLYIRYLQYPKWYIRWFYGFLSLFSFVFSVDFISFVFYRLNIHICWIISSRCFLSDTYLPHPFIFIINVRAVFRFAIAHNAIKITIWIAKSKWWFLASLIIGWFEWI